MAGLGVAGGNAYGEPGSCWNRGTYLNGSEDSCLYTIGEVFSHIYVRMKYSFSRYIRPMRM